MRHPQDRLLLTVMLRLRLRNSSIKLNSSHQLDLPQEETVRHQSTHMRLSRSNKLPLASMRHPLMSLLLAKLDGHQLRHLHQAIKGHHQPLGQSRHLHPHGLHLLPRPSILLVTVLTSQRVHSRLWIFSTEKCRGSPRKHRHLSRPR